MPAEGIDRKTCPNCGKTKPLSAFYRRRDGGPQSWCKVCTRLEYGGRRQSAEFRAWQEAYLARADVRERRAEADRRRQARVGYKARRKAYRATPRAKVLHCRREALRRLRRAEGEEKRARLRELIAAYDREIERLSRL